jgi:cbb3-type cytochrome oxidase maturation protein
MSMLFILVPLSMVLVAFAIWAFIWAVNSGQFDDLDSPAWNMLSDTNEPTVAATAQQMIDNDVMAARTTTQRASS